MTSRDGGRRAGRVSHDVSDFDRDGFALLAAFLDAAEVAEIEARVAERGERCRLMSERI